VNLRLRLPHCCKPTGVSAHSTGTLHGHTPPILGSSELQRLGVHGLELGDLQGNEFVITLRDVEIPGVSLSEPQAADHVRTGCEGSESLKTVVVEVSPLVEVLQRRSDNRKHGLELGDLQGNEFVITLRDVEIPGVSLSEPQVTPTTSVRVAKVPNR
jgi:hypothetical protein